MRQMSSPLCLFLKHTYTYRFVLITSERAIHPLHVLMNDGIMKKTLKWFGIISPKLASYINEEF
jgi:hypothetical protein